MRKMKLNHLKSDYIAETTYVSPHINNDIQKPFSEVLRQAKEDAHRKVEKSHEASNKLAQQHFLSR